MQQSTQHTKYTVDKVKHPPSTR